MTKSKHHFVPKLYLRAFQSAPKRIHLYNLNTSVAIENASLRDQCYKRRFYGPTDQIEDNLAVLEGHLAHVLQSIAAGNALPAAGSEQHEILLAFVALQLLRTTAAAKRVNVGIDKMMKQAYSHDPRFADADMEAVEFAYEDPVLASLHNLPLMLYAISDLRPHLVVSTEKAFLTSDNPAFKYNQYCEEIQHMGITGALNRGLQIFVPLAPQLQLILYDGTTYRVGVSGRSSRTSIATRSDVDRLNAIQLVSAEQNVYFSSWKQVEDVRRLIPEIRHHRDTDPIVVQEYGQDDNPNASLLHEFERTPYLKLRLSFLSLKWRARKVPLHARTRDYRMEIPMPPLPEPPHLSGRSVTFSRFLGRR
jgi:hypothetical protein